MSDELFYTSAPRGLRPGSSGFCTVAATRALGPGWIERLEAISGYKPLFAAGNPNESRNPVGYAHTRLTVAGQSRSVLSRLAASGFDHTGRSNKFVHHILPADAERGSPGPASLMRQPRTFDTAWSGGEPHVLPAGRRLTPQTAVSTPATTWQSVTGDAAWAAALAGYAADESSTIVYVVYPQGVDILALFDEAIRLLPEAQRWSITFNTYVTEPPVGVQWAWRGIVAGTPAVGLARGNVLDLTTLDTSELPIGPLAEVARTGRSQRVGSNRAQTFGDLSSGQPWADGGEMNTPISLADAPESTRVRRRNNGAAIPENVRSKEGRRSPAKVALAVGLPIALIMCVGVVIAVIMMTKGDNHDDGAGEETGGNALVVENGNKEGDTVPSSSPVFANAATSQTATSQPMKENATTLPGNIAPEKQNSEFDRSSSDIAAGSGATPASGPLPQHEQVVVQSPASTNPVDAQNIQGSQEDTGAAQNNVKADSETATTQNVDDINATQTPVPALPELRGSDIAIEWNPLTHSRILLPDDRQYIIKRLEKREVWGEFWEKPTLYMQRAIFKHKPLDKKEHYLESNVGPIVVEVSIEGDAINCNFSQKLDDLLSTIANSVEERIREKKSADIRAEYEKQADVYLQHFDGVTIYFVEKGNEDVGWIIRISPTLDASLSTLQGINQ